MEKFMKKFKILSVLLLGLLCSTILLPKQTIYTSANSTEDKLIIQSYGDSISYGEILTDLNDAYPNVFAKHYVDTFGAEFYANGISGSTSMSLLEKLQPYKDRTAPDIATFDDTDIVVLCIGANNILIPSVGSIPDYLSGALSKQEYHNLLNGRVEQFKEDYPQILEIFNNKKIIVMTVYNPYKHTTLKDMTIDPSVGDYTNLTKMLINNYDSKLQEMLDISMDYLQIINAEIKKSQNENVFVMDIWNLFSKFSKAEYLNYINANISNAVITIDDVENLMQGNPDSVLNKIYENCDPHPSRQGHKVIAGYHLENYKCFRLSNTSNATYENKIDLSITADINGNYTYKYYKNTSNGKQLILETSENIITIDKEELENANDIYAEIYSNENLVATSNIIHFEKPEEETNNNLLWLYITLGVVGTIGITTTITIITLKRHKKIKASKIS